MMLVMRFLMSLGCWWCFCNFTGKPPPTPQSFDLKASPGLVGLGEAPELAELGMAATCETQSRCSPQHHGVLRRWPVVSLEAAGQAGGWDGAQRRHSENGTYICCGTQGGSVKLPVIAIPIIAVPIIAISMNKPLFGARCLLYLSPRTCLKQIHLSWNPLCAATTVAAEG